MWELVDYNSVWTDKKIEITAQEIEGKWMVFCKHLSALAELTELINALTELSQIIKFRDIQELARGEIVPIEEVEP